MSGDLEDMRTYSRGYEDGRRSKDADHAAVAIRLSNLRFDGGSHENLSKIAYAIYPCATGWTCESSKGLRDRLIDLLGGVHEHRCDVGRSCARGDSHACGVGEPTEAMTYDVLGNERHKAVCKLRYIRDCLRGSPTSNSLNIADAIGAKLNVGDRLHESMCDRLIHLLGGDEPTAMEYIQRIVSEHDRKCLDMELSGTELSQASVDAMSRRADQSHESSPMSLENETGITDELRECIETATKTYEGSWYEMNDADHTICHITEGELLGIADRMDEQAKTLEHDVEMWRDRSEDMRMERDQLQERIDRSRAEYCETCEEAETCDQLRAKLEEADAAIANWRERERSFDESERERDELRRSLRQIAEWAGVPHDRDLSEYSDKKIANAVIGQLGQTNQYVKSLEWVRDRRLPRIEAERDELKAKMDAIREALDGNH